MYNIRDGWGFSLLQAIHAVQIRNYYLMLLTKTNITDKAYCHEPPKYDIMCSQAVGNAARGAQGGVGLVMREHLDVLSVESMCLHGTNMSSCEIVSGVQRTPLIEAYLTP